MPLLGLGTLEIDHSSGRTLNVLEAQRRLVVPMESRSMARSFALRDRLNQTKQQSSYAAVLAELVDWNPDLFYCLAAGDTMPPDEDKKHALMKMLPGMLSSEVRGMAFAKKSFQNLE